MQNQITNKITELKTLKSQVEWALGHWQDTRDSDKYLAWTIWTTFYGVGLTVSLEQFMKLPSEDAIKRIRAGIQNDEKRFLPTTLEVAKARGWTEQAWRIALGYSLDLFGQPEGRPI